MYRGEQQDRQRRSDKLPGHAIVRFEESFWTVIIARQCMTVKWRHSEMADLPLPHEGHVFLGKRVADWLMTDDFEEQVASNSTWHRKRVNVIKEMALVGVKAAKAIAPELIGLIVTFKVFSLEVTHSWACLCRTWT